MAKWSNRGLLIFGVALVLIGFGISAILSNAAQPDQTAVYTIEKARLIPPQEILTASQPFILDDFEWDGDQDVLTISEPQIWINDQGEFTHTPESLNVVELKLVWPETMRLGKPHLVRMTINIPAYDGQPTGSVLPEFVPETVYEDGQGLVNSSWTAVAETAQGLTESKEVSDNSHSPREMVWEWEVIPEKLQGGTIHFSVEKTWTLATDPLATPVSKTVWAGSVETWVISPESGVTVPRPLANISLTAGVVLCLTGVVNRRKKS